MVYNQGYITKYWFFTWCVPQGKQNWLTKKLSNYLINIEYFYHVDLPLYWFILRSSSTGTAQLPGEWENQR